MNQTIISLKRAEGRKKYEEVFERKIPEKVKTIKTRILSVFQTRLTDFSVVFKLRLEFALHILKSLFEAGFFMRQYEF